MVKDNYLFVVLGIVLLITLSPNFTGAMAMEHTDNLHEDALKFFEIEDIVFPEGACPAVVQELYWDLSHDTVDESKGYSTTGSSRVATTAVVLNRDEYGIIDFVKFPRYLEEKGGDSFIALSLESIANVPKAQRKTFLIMEFYGRTKDSIMQVTRGRFSIPSTDCIFAVKGGETICDCDLHPHKGVAVGGVSSSINVEETYNELLGISNGFSPLP
jgi:hypothetical protein